MLANWDINMGIQSNQMMCLHVNVLTDSSFSTMVARCQHMQRGQTKLINNRNISWRHVNAGTAGIAQCMPESDISAAVNYPDPLPTLYSYIMVSKILVILVILVCICALQV